MRVRACPSQRHRHPCPAGAHTQAPGPAPQSLCSRWPWEGGAWMHVLPQLRRRKHVRRRRQLQLLRLPAVGVGEGAVLLGVAQIPGILLQGAGQRWVALRRGWLRA